MSSQDQPSLPRDAGRVPHASHASRAPQVRRVTAAQAARWLLSGWRLFAARPLQWILLSVMVFALMAVISLLIVPVPVFGPMVPPVVFAILLASLLDTAARQESGATPGFADIYSGAMPHLGSLSLIGIFFSIPLIFLQLLVMLALAGGLLVGVFGVALGNALSGLLGGLAGFVSTVLAGGAVLLVLWLLMALILIFSPAMIVFARCSAFDAMSASLRASLRNIGPVLLFGLLTYLFFVVAMAPLGLGVLVFIPVFAGALRQAYLDMFTPAPGVEA
ncbi:hypothetical protein [Viridibacterium curvum]